MLGKSTSDFIFGSINIQNRFLFEHLVAMCSVEDHDKFWFFSWLLATYQVMVVDLVNDTWHQLPGCNRIKLGISRWPRLADTDGWLNFTT